MAKSPCPSATRFLSLLTANSRTRAQLLEKLVTDGNSAKEVRNVANFLNGTSRSASLSVRELLIRYARGELAEVIDATFFEATPIFLELTQQFLAKNRRYTSLIEANTGWFQAFMLESSDLERANKLELQEEPKLRERELKIFPDGDGSFGFEFDLHRRPTRGFVVATDDTIHLVGYDQKLSESMTYLSLMPEPQRIGLQGLALCGMHVGQARATESIPVKRMVARRIALVRKQPGERAPLPHGVVDWLAGRQSRRGINAGLIIDLANELSEDGD
ncbi:MAG: hypothetical protein HOP18_09405 [Deltaproteobacteria bacterium]|nr:hypothetical protein [Deltaproteobacteria bacterium]